MIDEPKKILNEWLREFDAGGFFEFGDGLTLLNNIELPIKGGMHKVHSLELETVVYTDGAEYNKGELVRMEHKPSFEYKGQQRNAGKQPSIWMSLIDNNIEKPSDDATEAWRRVTNPMFVPFHIIDTCVKRLQLDFYIGQPYTKEEAYQILSIIIIPYIMILFPPINTALFKSMSGLYTTSKSFHNQSFGKAIPAVLLDNPLLQKLFATPAGMAAYELLSTLVRRKPVITETYFPY